MSIFDLLSRLDEHRLHYVLLRTRPDAILVLVTLVGARIEICAFADGHLEVSSFVGDESVEGDWEAVEGWLTRAGPCSAP